MKRLLLNLNFFLFSFLLFGQNENPFSQFGYEAPIMHVNKDVNEGVSKEIQHLIIINTDTISAIGWIEIDVVNKKVLYFPRDGESVSQDSLPLTVLSRWLTTDPARQFSSPYMGMGNNPISGIDPDGSRNVFYNADGSYSHTEKNTWFHNTFFGNQIYVEDVSKGYTQISYAAFDNWQSDFFPQAWGSRAIDWRFTPKGNEINPVDGSVLGGGALVIVSPELFILLPAKLPFSTGSKVGDFALETINPVGGMRGLTTPNKFAGNLSEKEAIEVLSKKYGSPVYSTPEKTVFYNPATKRSFTIHNEPGHGTPHLDVNTRGWPKTNNAHGQPYNHQKFDLKN